MFGTGGFGSGGKLANFAAPTGDAKIGMANGIAKPIGSPNHGGSEDDASDDEGRDLKDLNEGADETDARFQHKDGRVVFSIDESSADTACSRDRRN